MPGARYGRGARYAVDMAAYTRAFNEEENSNTQSLNKLKERLFMALRQEVSPQELECFQLYYGQRMNMREIGEKLGVHETTVSRRIKSGEEKLRRCLRFGAAELLDQVGVATKYHSVRGMAKREGYENLPRKRKGK